MSSYVESVLASGEKIVYRATISRWKFFLSYFLGGLLVIAGIAAIFFNPFGTDLPMRFAGTVPLLLGLGIMLSAVIRRRTTELVLTDRRIIAKRGIVSRDTAEMNLTKVESLHVSQGFLGRMLDYGDVAVVGTGSSLEPMLGVSRPLELRRALGELADLPILKKPA